MLPFSVISGLPSHFVSVPFDLRVQYSNHLNLYPCFVSYRSPSPNSLLSTRMGWRVGLRNQSRGSLKLRVGEQIGDVFGEENVLGLDSQEQEEYEDGGSPWKDAIVYKRNASISHIEYCTTLERLGLGKISTEVSKSRASMMGIRVTKTVKDYTDGTPVLISLDVTRKKQRLRLDGILRTIITLGCNRCGEPTAKTVFSNFSLLLTEEPIEEPDMIQMNFSHKEEKQANGWPEEGNEEEDEDDLIDFDDRLYFPIQEKDIDISKHIRDLIHVEITIAEVCDPKCNGLCLQCGVNLNSSKCKCEMVVGKKGLWPTRKFEETNAAKVNSKDFVMISLL